MQSLGMFITIDFFISSIRPLSVDRPDRLIITTRGKGRLLDTFDEKRRQRSVADLVVYFNAAHLFAVYRCFHSIENNKSCQKILCIVFFVFLFGFTRIYLYPLQANNRDLFEIMLNKQRPTLLTFEDEDEFNQARTFFSNQNISIKQAGTNSFRYR
jgi:magnesium-transporting ATPase (P-type)